MNDAVGDGAARWADALLAAALFAVDPPGLGGIALRARAGPVRDRWMQALRALCPECPMPRLPVHADVDRLTGGIDLTATLQSGRAVAEAGLLEQADGGILLAAMAERLESGLAAVLGAALETGSIRSAAVAGKSVATTRFGLLALDEGIEPDERVPDGLADRLALHVDLEGLTLRDLDAAGEAAKTVAAARAQLARIEADAMVVETLCTAAVALGIASLRAPWLALKAARASAALAGRSAVDESDIAVAARLVLAPRATTLPASDGEPHPADEAEAPEDADDAQTQSSESDDSPPLDQPDPPEEPGPPETEAEGPESNPSDSEDQDAPAADDEAGVEQVLEAVRAAMPEGLLEASRRAGGGRARAASAGKSGALQNAGARGRPAGVRRGKPGPRARLNVVETLRAAAPWQKLRRTEPASEGETPRVQVRQEDFRVTRFKQRRETTTVFVVDASGSAALHRLAEAKGAVELLLADCYVRRDSVALVAFRGTEAELLLPPTRSLVQAKRRLAELPGGGGTPLATGLASALELGDHIVRRGATPVIVVLTDGRANIAADGKPGRERAHSDALVAAGKLRAAGLTVLFVDTAPRPRPLAEELAAAMDATYIPLPHADAAHLSAAIRAQTA